MSVLVLAADQKQAIPVVQSLGRRGIHITCLSPNMKAPSFYSKYCSEKIHFSGTSNEEEYATFLEDLIRKRKYDLIIPCSDYSTHVVSKYRSHFSPPSIVFLPDHGLVKTVSTKSKLMEFLLKHQIGAPQTYFLEDLSGLHDRDLPMEYPVVIKRGISSGAKHVRYARTKKELIARCTELHKKEDVLLIQEYIKGKDKLFYALCEKGEVIAYFMMEGKRAFPPTGGTPAKAVSITDQGLKEFAFNIVKTLGWTGMVGLDIKHGPKSKKYYLLDFNPRFGGTTVLAVKSGVDFPWLLYRVAVEGIKEYVYEYEKKTYRSLFREDVFHAVKNPLSIPKLLCEFCIPGIYYGYEKSDPGPFWRMAKNTLAELKNSAFSTMR
jgi:predicted ATP-grasp superfamily ATP-dependent carboligase